MDKKTNPKLQIFNRDGSVTEVEPIKPWSPCSGPGCTHPSHKKGMNQLPGRLKLMPCAPDVCQECAVDHPPGAPHNAQSLYYQYRFYAEHGRWPTWKDAMEHCTDEVKQAMIEVLKQHGINVEVA